MYNGYPETKTLTFQYDYSAKALTFQYYFSAKTLTFQYDYSAKTLTFQYKTDLKIMTFQFSGAATGRYEQTSFKSRGDYCRYSALTVMNVEEDNESLLAAQKEHDKLCSERTAYKKEADRISRLMRSYSKS